MSDIKQEKIAEIYDRIFKNDPLLLDEKNQEEYGKALLRHLLLNRTVASYNPEQVFLHRPETWDSFGQREPAQGKIPPAALTERYRASRRDRTEFDYKNSKEMTRDDLETKRKRDRSVLEQVTLVSRGEKTEKRNSLYSHHDDAIKDLQKDGCRSRIEKRLRIAAIGYRVQVSKLPDRGLLGEELVGLPPIKDHPIDGLSESVGFRELSRTRANPDVLNDWQRAIIAHIQAAHREGCHFIMLPEFSLPADLETSKMEERLAEICRDAPYSFFLFGGSRHEGGYNRGPVFSRTFTIDAEENAVNALSVSTERAWWHYKFAPARKLGENTLGRWGSKIPHYKIRLALNHNVKVGQNQEMQNYGVAIAICYDSFDPTMFLNIVMQCRSTVSHSIILVPSFNTSDDFVALLRDLSFLAQATVIYVNGLHGDARMFICGVSISELLAKADGLSRKLGREYRKADKRYEKIEAALKYGGAETREYQAARSQSLALKHLHERVLKLRRDGALKHLITVERGRRSDARKHGKLYVASDLLYYNIDTELIKALASFRAEFFMPNEEFLVPPLRMQALRDAAAHVVALRERKEQELQRARA